ncbi:hypothetical protein D9M70_564540 [compost metagenome]
MGGAVQGGFVRQHADKRLNVHEDLGTAENHQTEVAPADCLDGSARAEVEWREGHIFLCGPNN